MNNNDYTIINETEANPMVSVAMLTYGHENYIVEAIESVLNQQTTFSVQLVIAEDCSPDSTRSIIEKYQKEYPEKIKLILQNQNVGASNNNVDLFANLDGKYIAALEGDDYWIDPLKLQKQVDYLEADDSIVICATNYKSFKNNTDLFQNVEICKISKLFTFDDLLINNKIGTLTAVFKNLTKEEWSEFHNQVKEQDFIMGDYPMWLYLMRMGGTAKLLPDYTAHYRILDESASNTRDLSKIEAFELNTYKIKYFYSINYRNRKLEDDKLYAILDRLYIYGLKNAYFKLYDILNFKNNEYRIKAMFLNIPILRKIHMKRVNRKH